MKSIIVCFILKRLFVYIGFNNTSEAKVEGCLVQFHKEMMAGCALLVTANLSAWMLSTIILDLTSKWRIVGKYVGICSFMFVLVCMGWVGGVTVQVCFCLSPFSFNTFYKVVNYYFNSCHRSLQKVFAEAEDAGAGDNLLGSQVDWPSEDSEDDDYNPETPKPSEHGEVGEENGSDDELGSDSGSDSDSDSSDDGSEVEFFDEFAGTSRSKKGQIFEDDETEDVLEDHVEADDAALVTGKRQRADVDYKQLYDVGEISCVIITCFLQG